ncbi:MAG: leucine-rich repeat protein, partial [Ruminiclostridium sp.]|nr:leucine-rich repeat protein [Ruminiclostridium sp.]
MSFDKDYGIHYVNDTLLAFVELGTPVEQVEEAVSAVNGSIIGRDDLLNLYQIQVETSTLSELKTLADQLEAANPCVSLAVYDTAYPESVSNMTAVPNDPWNGDVSAVDWRDTDIDGSNWWIEAVEGQQAWGAADRFAEIPVGVVDSSFDIDHEDLEDQYRFASDGAERRNLTDADSRAHGTHVAGIIGAEADNGVGISGLARNAELIFSPGASRSDGVIFQAISEAVQAGAKVVNMSQGLCQDLGVGIDTWDEEVLQTTATVYASIMAVLLEQGEDFIMVQSAGNGNNRGNTGSEPVDAIQNKWFCSITEETIFVDVEGVTIQDILDHIIIVGNAEQNGSGYRCEYNSNFGSQVDLYAPGTSVYSTFPTESGGYSVQGGTSMAAPVVSAVCALTWGVRPELSGADIRNIVCSATNKTVAPHPDSGCDLSYPLVNARLSVETALQYVAASDGEKQTYPVTVKVRYEDGTPASGVTIDGTGLATAPQTSVDGSVLFFLEEGNYRLSANPTGYFDQAVLTINERTTIELTLKKTMFVWALDGTGTQLTISGWGPMPDYTTSNMPWGKSITSVSISGVASIGKNAFYNCTALADVTMDENVTAIGYRAFYGCKNLASAPLPKDLFSLGEKAFYGCTVLDVPAIPEMVTIVEKEAFYNCDAITSVTVPAGVTSFGESVFGHCGALAKAILLPVDAQINKRTFYECTALTSVYAPNGLSVVGVQAFYNCTKLDYIPSLEGVTVIEESAFYNCKALSRVTIPETVTEIENYAFQNCTSLGVVALPEGLTTIGLQVFCNCDSLTSVT